MVEATSRISKLEFQSLFNVFNESICVNTSDREPNNRNICGSAPHRTESPFSINQFFTDQSVLSMKIEHLIADLQSEKKDIDFAIVGRNGQRKNNEKTRDKAMRESKEKKQ